MTTTMMMMMTTTTTTCGYDDDDDDGDDGDDDDVEFSETYDETGSVVEQTSEANGEPPELLVEAEQGV